MSATTYTFTPENSYILNRLGANNGIAELDSSGKVPASQLPSYVDDVVEVPTYDDFPITGESGKIYVDLSTNKTYRWGGSSYFEISESLALGETESTAYRGDRGKEAYDHAMAKGRSFSSGFYKVATNTEGHVTNVVPVAKSDIVNLGIPGDDFVGATTDATGVHGYVPAPAVEDRNKFLSGNGTWKEAPGAKLIEVVLTPISNESGAYTGTTRDFRVTAGMKCIMLELGNPAAFKSNITVTAGAGTVTLTCASVEGESSATASFLKTVEDPTAITTSEFDYLENAKVDKAPTAVEGHFVSFNTVGNLIDSGYSANNVIVVPSDVTEGKVPQTNSNREIVWTDLESVTTDLQTQVTSLNNSKLDKPTLVAAGKFLQTDSNGDAVWGDAASPTDVANAVTNWLDDNIPTGQTVAIDQSLTINGAAADAKKTGDQLSDLKSALSLSFITSSNYELGYISISTTGWVYSSSGRRIRIKQGTTIRLYKGDTINSVANSGVQFTVGWLNDNGRYNCSREWITSFICPVTADYVITARNYPEVNISDISTVIDNIIIHSTVNVETIKSIQDDVTTIENHNKTVNDIVGIYNADVSNFDIGNIDITSSGWTYTSRETRVRTKSGFTIPLKKNDIIGLTDYSNARMYIGYQKSDGTYGISGGWKTSDYICPDDGNYVILLCHSSDEYLNSIEELLSLLQIIMKPEDISGTVQEIGNTVNKILSGELYSFPTKYGKWTMPPLSWAKQASGIRVNTNDFDVSKFKAIVYSVPIGYQVGIRLFDENNIERRDSGWDTTGIGFRMCGGASYARIVVRKSDDSSIDTDDITSSFVFALLGCKLYSYNDGTVQTIYHRGLSKYAPENTAISFICTAKERGLFVETDVRYTSDGIPVLLHDATINRTGRNADGTSISETINISDITYEQALQYDFGIWKGQNFAGQKILSFNDFLSLCVRYELHPVVELKDVSEDQAKALYQTAVQYGLKGKISWISSAWSYHLQKLTEVDPAVDFYWLSTLDASHVAEAIALKTEFNRIHIDTSVESITSATQELINTALDAGIEIAAWDTDDENWFIANVNKHGVTGITTNGTDADVAMLLASGLVI